MPWSKIGQTWGELPTHERESINKVSCMVDWGREVGKGSKRQLQNYHEQPFSAWEPPEVECGFTWGAKKELSAVFRPAARLSRNSGWIFWTTLLGALSIVKVDALLSKSPELFILYSLIRTNLLLLIFGPSRPRSHKDSDVEPDGTRALLAQFVQGAANWKGFVGFRRCCLFVGVAMWRLLVGI